jgi:hypothetical protein
LDDGEFGVWQGGEGFLPQLPQSVLYLTIYLRPGHAAACFGRNQLTPSSMNLSLLYAGHANDLHIKTACGPPRTFRHASTCPRIDHWASGLILQTPRTFNTSSHAKATDSLARSSKRTLRHRQPHPYYRLATGFFVWKILSCHNPPSPVNFRRF